MKNRALLVLTLVFSIFTSTLGQTPAPQKKVEPADENEVVRITTNLIQVDAVVTDKSGKVVSNLGPEDFEILVNGKPQKITNFSFVTSEPRPVEPAVARGNTNRNAPPLPPVRLRPEHVRRTVALVVDDLGLSWESINHVRAALKKFVDEHMQPGDLVSIIRVGKGVGALQQFTTDKRELYAAIERVQYNPISDRIVPFSAVEGAGDQASE